MKTSELIKELDDNLKNKFKYIVYKSNKLNKENIGILSESNSREEDLGILKNTLDDRIIKLLHFNDLLNKYIEDIDKINIAD